MKTVFNSLGSNYDWDDVRASMRADIPGARQTLSIQLEERYKAKEVKLTYKGREAITLALKAFALPKESFVAINGYTCYAVYESIVAAGLKPYYLDIPNDELNFNARTLSAALKKEKNIKAVMIQNTLGVPCEIREITKICKDKKLIMIEDLAHSIGLIYPGGKEAGTLGDAAALSFSQDKMIDAVSGGAAIFKKRLYMEIDDDIFEPVASKRRMVAHSYPSSTWVIRHFYSLGLGKILHKVLKNLNLLPKPMDGNAAKPHLLSGWHAHLASHAFSKLGKNIRHRRSIAKIYRDKISNDVQYKHFDESIYLRFPLRVKEPKKLIAHLSDAGIFISDIWYDAPIGPIKCLEKTDYRGQCPAAEEAAITMVNLPTHKNISKRDARLIAKEVSKWLKLQPAK